MFNPLLNVAHAMGAGGGAGGQAGGFGAFIPLILMFVIFYFLLIRPQQKKTKAHREMVENIKKGDRIITSGGLYGRVTAVSDANLTVEISDRVRVKLARHSVSGLVEAPTAPPPAPKKKTGPKSSDKQDKPK